MTPMADDKFYLSAGQTLDPLWRRLKEHIEQTIDQLRKQNDNENLSPEKTAFMRGRIKALKDLLELENPPPVIADGNFVGHG